MYRYLLLSVFVLSGCITTHHNPAMSMSEISGEIVSSPESVVRVKPDYDSGFSGNVSVSSSFSSSHQHSKGDDLGGYSVFDSPTTLESASSHAYLIGKRSAINLGVSKYKLKQGYELAYIGQYSEAQTQQRIALFYQTADFNDPSAAGFSKPIMFGLEFDFRKALQYDPIALFSGLRLSGAFFHYDLNKPVVIEGEIYRNDMLGVFGLGLPLGMQLNSGWLMLEASVVPSLYLHSFSTSVGFENDFVFMNAAMPVSVGLGVNF